MKSHNYSINSKEGWKKWKKIKNICGKHKKKKEQNNMFKLTVYIFHYCIIYYHKCRGLSQL